MSSYCASQAPPSRSRPPETLHRQVKRVAHPSFEEVDAGVQREARQVMREPPLDLHDVAGRSGAARGRRCPIASTSALSAISLLAPARVVQAGRAGLHDDLELELATSAGGPPCSLTWRGRISYTPSSGVSAVTARRDPNRRMATQSASRLPTNESPVPARPRLPSPDAQSQAAPAWQAWPQH